MPNGTGNHSQPFGEHVRELRQRLLISIAVLFMGCSVGYLIHARLFTLITQPLHQPLYYTTPTGGFNAIIKISILFGVLVTIPVAIYQLSKFLSPAFRWRVGAGRIILTSVFLAAAGALFAYYLSLPAALDFLTKIGGDNIKALITVNEYLNFVFAYIAGFALLFQLPLVMLFINRIKPQKPGKMMRVQRWVVLFSFIAAAILTPTPDPINQTIMALPIILLYQLSVIMIWLTNRRESKQSLAAVAEQERYAEPEPQVAYEAPGGAYGTTSYGAASSFVAQQPQAESGLNPNLITDIFWSPQNPTA